MTQIRDAPSRKIIIWLNNFRQLASHSVSVGYLGQRGASAFSRAQLSLAHNEAQSHTRATERMIPGNAADLHQHSVKCVFKTGRRDPQSHGGYITLRCAESNRVTIALVEGKTIKYAFRITKHPKMFTSCLHRVP